MPGIVHENCKDEVTSLERQLIGVLMDDGNVSDGYASLIVALEPDGNKGPSDGNIKCISNRNVSNVTNLSRMDSWYTLQISVRYDQPLNQIEDMLMRELPAIGEGIHEIIEGPVCRGITAAGSGKATLSLAAECSGQDLGAVRSKLNLAILRIFERNNIPIR